MSAKHTPGPWVVIDGTAIWSKSFQTNTAIAKVNRRIDDTTRANARLMAAAPDLLEALQELAEMCDQCDSWQSFPDAPVQKAYAAIGKATGEQ